MHIRVDDTVEIISGEDRGSPQAPTRGRVLRVMREQGKIVVEGINRVYRHVKRGARNSQQGGRLSKEMPISISNVMLVCSQCGQAARTGSRLRADGTKERFCKKCSAGIGVISRSKAARASTS
jgi:large subunit ribosomal protein L24